MFYLTIFIPLSVSGKFTGTLSGFMAHVKPASFGLLCAWCEVLILRQHPVRLPLRYRGSPGYYALCPFHLHDFGDVILASKMEVIRA
jgi:hypothetical protein